MTADDNYYNNLWTGPNSHGTVFWNNVNHDTEPYRYQENVFRYYLKVSGLRPRTVLELGCGTGRMTKIVLEELGPIFQYDAIDIKIDQDKIWNNIKNVNKVGWKLTTHEMNIVEDDFIDNEYDLIVCSEILMHILPSDIDSVISKISKLLSPNGNIINIDWCDPSPELENSDWCFIHDYNSLYSNNGLVPIGHVSMPSIKQGLYDYRLDN